MIERFYEPIKNKNDGSLGEILFDNMNIRDIKLKNLRESIGYVP